jgi:hypothetical protein
MEKKQPKKGQPKKKAQPKNEIKIHSIQAGSLEEALEMIAKQLGREFKSSKSKSDKKDMTDEELNSSWNEYADNIREGISSGELALKDAVMIGLHIDTTADNAKTAYLAKGMIQLAIDLIEYIMLSEENTQGNGIPADKLEEGRRRGKEAIERYRERLEAIDKKGVKVSPAEAEKKQAEEKKEKEHCHAPASGIFANVSLNDILNAPKADGLPNF